MKSKTTAILWFVYLCLLLVLLPHTASIFAKFEPAGGLGTFSSWVGAFAFESAIAALTHKLAKHIETTRARGTWWNRFSARYLNPFAFGLLIATFVSALANLAHAVEFGQELKIFTQWGISVRLYSLAFGGVLPLVSLTFARVLSNVVDSEDAPNPELEQAKQSLTEVRRQLRESELRLKAAEERVKVSEDKVNETEHRLKASEAQANASEEKFNNSEQQLLASEAQRRSAEDRARLAEERFGAIGDMVKYLFSEDKRRRIIAVHQQWPGLPGSSIAIIASSSPSYVSQVLQEADTIEVGQGS